MKENNDKHFFIYVLFYAIHRETITLSFFLLLLHIKIRFKLIQLVTFVPWKLHWRLFCFFSFTVLIMQSIKVLARQSVICRYILGYSLISVKCALYLYQIIYIENCHEYLWMFFFAGQNGPRYSKSREFETRCYCVIVPYWLLNGDQIPKTNKTLIYLIGIFG